jgi:hypothetical protein
MGRAGIYNLLFSARTILAPLVRKTHTNTWSLEPDSWKTTRVCVTAARPPPSPNKTLAAALEHELTHH